MSPKILAVRHGQSIFNIHRLEYESDEACNRDGVYVPDCNITELGVTQSRQAGRELIHKHLTTGKVHFVVSPLRRALQTAEYILEGISQVKPGWKPHSMTVQPLATEVMIASCDIGTPVKALHEEFPGFDMTLVEKASANGYWWPFHRSVDETWKLMQEGVIETDDNTQMRMTELKEYLANDKSCQNADVVVMVCHSDTIWWLTGRPGTKAQNCEIVDLTKVLTN